jgi:hypothetical protein
MLVVLTYNSFGFYAKVSFNDTTDLSKVEMIEKHKNTEMSLGVFSSKQRPTDIRVYNR